MLHILIFLCALFVHSANSSWVFAVTSKHGIVFYNHQWEIVKTSAHQFNELSALTLNEVNETIYFYDEMPTTGGIFSLQIPFVQGGSDVIKKIATHSGYDMIRGLAHDPVERYLYWADSRAGAIFRTSLDDTNVTNIVRDFSDSPDIPDGIAIDICHRKLYWSNSNHRNASIEMSDLNGSNRTVIVNSDLYLPHGLYIDNYSNRIYYVVDQEGIFYSIESTDLNGNDRQIIVKGINNIPYDLVVTDSTIYWTDLANNAVWSVAKFRNVIDDAEINPPIKVKTFQTQPRGIVYRREFLKKMADNSDCKDVVKELREKLSDGDPSVKSEERNEMFCLNSGDFVGGICQCKMGFTGLRCETNECYNFCVHGTCSISEKGLPKCQCQLGYTGDRCEAYKCDSYCLNEGKCIIDGDMPTCKCADEFAGGRCELTTQKMVDDENVDAENLLTVIKI